LKRLEDRFNHKQKLFPIAILGFLLFPFATCWAQSAAGTISGTVADDSGAVVPGAQVTVKNTGTSLSRVLTTNERGRYVAPQLSLGSYEVTAGAQGFQTEVRQGITLMVGQEAAVDFVLRLGAVTERVEVTGEASLVETTTATTSGLVNEMTVRELPLNGRSFTDLMDLQPNVKKLAAVGSRSDSQGFGQKFSVNGSHPNQNNYIMDGLVINDSRVQTPSSSAGVLLGTDTIREFRLMTSNYSAEFGQVSGGIMTAVTKSGTNALHGSAFEYLRNSALDARSFFDRGGVPPFKRNQFGFTLGGPLKKDRTFFFGSYEGLRQRLANTVITRVPTAAARRGFLPGGSCLSGCTVGATAQKVLNIFPLPNATDHGDGTADYVSAPSNPTNEDYFTIRLDHNFTQKHFMFGRYTFDQGHSEDIAPPPAVQDLFTAAKDNRTQYLLLNITSLLTPSLLNTATAGMNRSPAFTPFKVVTQQDISPLISIPGRYPSNVAITDCCTLGPPEPRYYWWTSFQYSDDMTYTPGNHSLKFGAALFRSQDNRLRYMFYGANWSFASLQNYYSETPTSLNTATPQADAQRGLRQWTTGAYLQDNWKVFPGLTLNLGIRFEWVTVPTEVHNRIGNIRNIYTDQATTAGAPWWNQASAFAHAAPRLGFAWDPFGNGKTSLRGGLGIFQESIRETDFSTPSDRNAPFYVTTLLTNMPGSPLTYPLAFNNFGRPGLPPIFPRVEAMGFNLDQPYKVNWNFSIQREILPNTLFNIGYAGSRGIHLLGLTSDDNSPPSVLSAGGRRYIPVGTPRLNPNFTQIRMRDTGHDSYYNSLQIGVGKRFSRGLQFNSSYTWSKSIDTSSLRGSQGTDFVGNSDQESYPFDTKANRGLSSWDLRHYWSSNFVYELPVGPGKSFGAALKGAAGKLLVGWNLSGVLTMSSGPAFSPALAFDYAGALPQSSGGGQRPDLIPGKSLNPVLGKVNQYFDPFVFDLPPLTPEFASRPECLTAQPAATCRRVFGNVGRHTIIGPGITTFDLNLSKNTKVAEKSELQFRVEIFNLFNRANFGIPNTTVFLSGGRRDVTAGRITSVVTSSRQIQFALRYAF